MPIDLHISTTWYRTWSTDIVAICCSKPCIMYLFYSSWGSKGEGVFILMTTAMINADMCYWPMRISYYNAFSFPYKIWSWLVFNVNPFVLLSA